MAVRFDAAGDYFSRTTSLPSTTSWTFMVWVYLSADPGGYHIAFSRGSGGVNFGFNLDSRRTYIGGSADFLGTTDASLNTWYHICWVSGGQTGNYYYLNGAVEISNQDIGVSVGGSNMYLGQNNAGSGNDRVNGRFANCKIFEAQLTQAEVQAEMYTYLPKRTANLYGWYPILPGATERLADYSGNGRSWTGNGTLTDEDPPPISWGGPFVRIPSFSAGTLYIQSVSGGVTPTGALLKQPGKIFAGVLVPSGAISRQPQITKGGVLVPAGTILKQTSRALTGAVTPAGTANKETQKSFAGGLTPSGVAAFIKQAVLSVGGSLTPSGVLTKLTAKSFTGGLTPTGALAAIKTALLSIGGSLAPSGILSRQTGKQAGGSLTPSGLLTKLTSKTFSGGLTPSGALAGIKTVLLSIGGSLTPSGVLSRQTQKIFGGSLTPSGTLSKSVGKTTSGALTPAGTLAAIKTALLSIGGSLTPTGTIIRQTQKIAGGGLVLTGTLNKEIRKVLTGGLTPSGVLVALRTVLLSVGGSLTPSGTLATQAGVVITRIIGAIRTIAYERFRALIQDSSPYRVVTSDAAVYEVTISDEDII